MKHDARAIALLVVAVGWGLLAPHVPTVLRIVGGVVFSALWMAAYIWAARRWPTRAEP